MPLPAPQIDSRNFQQLVDDTLARVPVHTPEWTNFNASDPGVTLVHLFAFVTEALIYRANQIPERNRRKFLNLLGIPLCTAKEARGLAVIRNENGPPTVETLASNVELFAGEIPFRTQLGLDVLPVEGRLFMKRPIDTPDPALLDYYRLLYASYGSELPLEPALYESVQIDPGKDSIDLGRTSDRSLWIAILARVPEERDGLRDTLANRTLSLGLAPQTYADTRTLFPGGAARPPQDLLAFEMPRAGDDGLISFGPDGRPLPAYRRLEVRTDFDPLTDAGVVQIPLPGADGLRSWENLDPLEAGVGDLPPAIEDSAATDRLVTWLRVRVTGGADVKLRWAGINATPIRQIARVFAEALSEGDGTPDQIRRLARPPVLEGSIRITSVDADGEHAWAAIDDLIAAGAEVPVSGTKPSAAPTDVFLADYESGTIRFGDGLAGRRPAAGAQLFATYLYSEGFEGNLGADAIKTGPLLPAGFTATNPLPTWGGADAERVEDGERHVRRYLQHRDRLVTAADFETIAWRTPGVVVGRIEVLPAWHPALAPAAPGSAPGVVTLLAIPRYDPANPQAPRADRPFLDALCRYLEPRRLITTELVLHGAIYKGIWISVGIESLPGASVAATCEAVRQRLRDLLSPLPSTGFAGQQAPLYGPPPRNERRGWPLGQAIQSRVLLAEAARVLDVKSVGAVLLAEGSGPAVEAVPINGIELPEILGISVVAGDPVELASLRGEPGPQEPAGTKRLPVPVVAETC
ncbi:MAG TPA: hypothetical protein VMN38_01980 [Sphingomicrobium sp.]|nr:hypothetical protein [Sphingomicrobium sp.]